MNKSKKNNRYFGKFLLDFIYKNTDSEYMYESDDLDDVKRVCDKLIDEAIEDGYSLSAIAFCIYQEIGQSN